MLCIYIYIQIVKVQQRTNSYSIDALCSKVQ